MCVVSQIMDYGRQVFPQQPYQVPGAWPPHWPQPIQPITSAPVLPPNPPVAPALPSPEEMQKWIEAFRKLVAAGEEFDRVTGQPDCVDPEKAELLERLAAVEKRLAQFEEGVDKPE